MRTIIPNIKFFLLLGLLGMLSEYTQAQVIISITPDPSCVNKNVTFSINNAYQALCPTTPRTFYLQKFEGGTWNTVKTQVDNSVMNYTPTSDLDTDWRIQVENSSNAICATSNQMGLIVNEEATVNISTPASSICEDGSITLNGNFDGSATSMTWSSNVGGSFSSTSNPTTTYTPPSGFSGNATITLTTNNPAGPCDAVSDQVLISVDAQPTLDPTSNTSVVCQGESFNLNAGQNTAVSSMTWSASPSSAGSFNNANASSPVFTSNANFDGQVTISIASNGNGECLSVTEQLTLNVRERATIDISTSATNICENSFIDLNGSFGGGASSMTWSSNVGGSFSSISAATTTFTPPSGFSGNATITLTSNNPSGPCPAVSDNVVITVDAQPTVDPSSNNTVVCQGGSFNLNAGQNSAATSVTWSASPSSAGTFSNANASSTIFTSNANYNGQVTVTVSTNSNGECLSVTEALTLNINEAATVNISTLASSICEDGSITLNGNFDGGANSMNWSSSVGGSFSSTSASTTTYTPPSGFSGNTTITLTTNNPSGPCPAVSDNVVINVDAQPQVNPTVDNAIKCQGESFTLTAGQNSAATAVTWTVNPSSAGGFGNATGFATDFFSNNNYTGSFEVCVQPANNGTCDGVAECINLNVPAPPSVTITSPGLNTEICQNEIISINTNSSGDISVVSWSITPSNAGTLSSTSSLNPTFTAGGNAIGDVVLEVTVIGEGTCQSVTKEISLEILDGPDAPVPTLAGDDILCELDASFVFSATPTGAVFGSWSDGNGGGTFDTPTATTATYTNPTPGTYCIFYSTSSTGCGDIVSPVKCVEIVEAVYPSVFIDNSSLCMGENFTINGNINGNFSSVGIWSDNGVGGMFLPDNSSIANQYIPPSNYTGDIDLQFEAQPTSGPCFPEIVLTTITVKPIPSSMISIEEVSTTTGSTDGDICEGEAVLLSVIGGSNYTWTNDLGLTNPTGATWNLEGMTTSGNFNVTAELNGCMSSSSVSIEVAPDPNLDILVQSPCVGETFNLELESLSSNLSNFQWTQNGNVVSNQMNHEVTNVMMAQSGEYIFTAEDAFGCVWSATEDVNIEDIPAPVIPETFKSVCQNARVFYTVESVAPNSNFVWEISPTIADEDLEIIDGVLFVHWTTAGEYNVSVTEYFGDNATTPCKGTDMLTVTVTNGVAPDTSQIIYHELNDIMIVKDPEVNCYQWGYYDPVTRAMVTIPGETYQAFSATGDAIRAYDENRIYWVQTWNTAGGDCGTPECGTISIRTEKAEQLAEQEDIFSIYPNPNQGNFKVKVNNMPKASYQLKVVDMFGREVLNREVLTNDSNILETFSIQQSLANGVYMLFIYDDLDVYRQGKFIVTF